MLYSQTHRQFSTILTKFLEKRCYYAQIVFGQCLLLSCRAAPAAHCCACSSPALTQPAGRDESGSLSGLKNQLTLNLKLHFISPFQATSSR